MDCKKIEKKWQQKWEKSKIFEADVSPKKEKFFTSIVIPYVNGRPHIGHIFTYTRSDTYARFKRMQGFNTLLAVGFHATGEPILGTIERLKSGDPTQKETFKMYGATDKDIENFVEKGPEFVAKYWMNGFIRDFKSIGYSIDWRRIFITAVTPTFNRFVEWQYNMLKGKDYVIQGTHPVIWCPHDQSPTGDHDRLEGVGESPIEYVIIKFKLPTGEIIPTATLRPETVYGVTNIWISPEADYVRTKVDNETWILSEPAAEKLKDQLKKIQIIDKIKGSDIIGKHVQNPVTKADVIILPANFVDPNGATGIVMSVPSHAPYDWISLKDLQKDVSQLKRYDVNLEEVESIRPISLIKAEGFGENPAIEICDKMLITNQNEKEKLDEATSQVYKKEFHTGVLKDNTAYPGEKVSEVKDKLIDNFVSKGVADKIWETTGTVVCRCKTLTHVKILENQWFLKYSDKKWKDKVKKAITQMKFYPEDVRNQFLNTVDWLDDKACARKSGLGTKLPWDKEWIVETLSDSTIYMAYYTIAKIINKNKIPAEKLTDEVFDYIFLGKGNTKNISKKSKLGEKLIKDMRNEFEYFYPLDFRNSAKDLVQNHLTYALFQHTAIWEESKYWPKAYAVNGFVTVSGEKMAKSKGNFIPLKDLLDKYGADLIRINMVTSNENMDDADWKDENVTTFTSRFSFLEGLVKQIKKAKRNSTLNIDNYLQSKIQKIIKGTTENFEVTKFRSGSQVGFFDFVNEIKWYIERCGGIENCNKKVLGYALSVITQLIAPFVPYFSEEIWSRLGNKNFVSVSEWPKSNGKLIDELSELKENLVKQTIDDIKNIQQLTKVATKEAVIIVAPSWKFDAYKILIENRNADMRTLIELISNKAENKEVAAKYVQYNFRKLKELPEKFAGREEQMKILEEAKKFIEKQVSAKILVQEAENSQFEKAKQADVTKPAIFIS